MAGFRPIKQMRRVSSTIRCLFAHCRAPPRQTPLSVQCANSLIPAYSVSRFYTGSLLKGNFIHKLHLDSILRCFEVVKLTGKTTNLTSAIGNISSEEGTVSKRRAHPIVEHSSDNHNVSVWILGLVSCRGQR